MFTFLLNSDLMLKRATQQKLHKALQPGTKNYSSIARSME